MEEVGFRRLVETLNPRYEIPSPKYFSNTTIPALFEKTRERVVVEITSARYYSATTDMRVSSMMEPYLSYSIHFIDSESSELMPSDTICIQGSQCQQSQ